MADASEFIRFPCGRCETRLKAPQSLSGSTLKCPKCRHENQVPLAQAEHQTWQAAQPVVDAAPHVVWQRLTEGNDPDRPEQIPVVCKVCDTRTYARLDEVGELSVCPVCYTKNEVRPLQVKTRSKQFVSEGPDYELSAEPVTPLADVHRRIYAANCTHCNYGLEVTAAMLGSNMTCPRCHRIFLLPVESELHVATQAEEDLSIPALRPLEGRRPVADIDLDEMPALRPAVPSNTPGDKAFDEALQEAQRRKLLDEDQHAPDGLPEFPFWNGIWGTALQEEVLMGSLGCVLIHIAINYLSFQVISMGLGAVDGGGLGQGPMVVGQLLLSIFTGIVSSVWFILFSNVLMPVLQDTANGYDRIQHWAEGGLFGRFMNAMYLFSSCFLMMVPGGMAYVICTETLGLPWMWAAVIGLPIACLSHAFWLIALLDAGNPLIPWSPMMVSSLERCLGSWMLFFFLAIPLQLMMLVTSGAASAKWGGVLFHLAMIVAPFVFAYASITYFRLIGRLAAVVGLHQLERDEAEKAARPAAGDRPQLVGATAGPVSAAPPRGERGSAPYADDDFHDPFA